MNEPVKKQHIFGEIEDVISVGALLRPTVAKAVTELSSTELTTLRERVIEAERELANSRLEFSERFRRAQECLRATYDFAPTWRFIADRIAESWTGATTLTVKELSIVSLLFGILLEETNARLAKKSKRSA
ncbi:MAG: hypothetical protein JST04_10835 [Bdellovibrionales bacterium]|nr:hypothetical protein [Bdellovibrionales bacterium]